MKNIAMPFAFRTINNIQVRVKVNPGMNAASTFFVWVHGIVCVCNVCDMILILLYTMYWTLCNL